MSAPITLIKAMLPGNDEDGDLIHLEKTSFRKTNFLTPVSHNFFKKNTSFFQTKAKANIKTKLSVLIILLQNA